MMASRLAKTPFLQAKRQLAAQAAAATKPAEAGLTAGQVCPPQNFYCANLGN